MCGRYQRKADKQRIAEAFQLGNVDGLSLEFAPHYNAAPQSMQPVIAWDGAVPPSATDLKTFKLDTILARGEKLLENNT